MIPFKKQLFDLEVKGQGPVSPSNDGRHDIVLVWSFLPLLLLLSEACPNHNFFVFRDRSMIFGMWVHDHKAVCRKNCFRYLKLMSPLNKWYYLKTIIWPWGQRSRSNEGHYGTLPVQSVSITIKVVRMNSTHGKTYSIQHYVIKFISELWQVSGFLWVFRFSPPINLTTTI
jgi:hypothetical protein